MTLDGGRLFMLQERCPLLQKLTRHAVNYGSPISRLFQTKYAL